MSDESTMPVVGDAAGPLAEQPDDPPVVARLVIEIRSDGTRTIARGVVEDQVSGQTVGVRAEGATPAALLASMLRSLPGLPGLRSVGLKALRALLVGPRK